MQLHALFALILYPTMTGAIVRWGPSRRTSSKLNMATINNASTDNIKTIDVLSLQTIRSSLIRQEETIIFALIERAQFRQNSIVYRKGGFGKLGIPAGSLPIDDNELSFLEFMLVGTEVLHCSVRRYTSPEEHPFFPERLPDSPMDALPSLQYPCDLLSPIGGADQINFNKQLLRRYIDEVVPSIAKKGDDEQHGSTVLCDIAVLQALSRRVHYGKFVAESKYRSDPEEYQRLINAGDAEGVMKLLTNEEVEEQVLRRARLKAATYGVEPLLSHSPRINFSDTKVSVAAAHEFNDSNDEEIGKKIDPIVIENVYRDITIPMTKVIEVAYLFRRCGREPPPQYLP